VEDVVVADDDMSIDMDISMVVLDALEEDVISIEVDDDDMSIPLMSVCSPRMACAWCMRCAEAGVETAAAAARATAT